MIFYRSKVKGFLDILYFYETKTLFYIRLSFQILSLIKWVANFHLYVQEASKLNNDEISLRTRDMTFSRQADLQVYFIYHANDITTRSQETEKSHHINAN